MKDLSFDNSKLSTLLENGKFPIYLYFDAKENKFKFHDVEKASAIGVIWKNPFNTDVVPSDTEKQSIYERVKIIFAEKLDRPLDEVVSSAIIKSDLNADSMDIFEIVMELENAFGITISDLATEKLHSIGDFQKLCAKLVAQKETRTKHGV